MARKTKGKARKIRKSSRSAKRSTRRSGRRASPAAARAGLSRDVVEELLFHSARSGEGEELSDKALTEIARAAGLDPARVLDAHRRLRETADQDGVTVLRVVEIWGSDGEDEEEEGEE